MPPAAAGRAESFGGVGLKTWVALYCGIYDRLARTLSPKFEEGQRGAASEYSPLRSDSRQSPESVEHMPVVRIEDPAFRAEPLTDQFGGEQTCSITEPVKIGLAAQRTDIVFRDGDRQDPPAVFFHAFLIGCDPLRQQMTEGHCRRKRPGEIQAVGNRPVNVHHDEICFVQTAGKYDLIPAEFRFVGAAWRGDGAEFQKLLPAGMTDGVHELEIARCVPLFEYDREGEDILASDYKQFPLWADIDEAKAAAQTCTTALRLRYLLRPDAIVPIPKSDNLSSRLKDKYLWLDMSREIDSAIRLVYNAGTGWIPLKEWKHRASKHPLILKFMADGLTEGGAFVSLEVEPWEYDLLVRRTLERLNQNTSNSGGMKT